MRITVLASALFAALTTASVAHAFDEAAAKSFAKQNDCFKCHAPDKTKKGPSYKKLAGEYRDKFKGKDAEAEAEMLKHLTSSRKVKLEDGTEEEHKALDSKKDGDKIKNLIQWVRSH